MLFLVSIRYLHRQTVSSPNPVTGGGGGLTDSSFLFVCNSTKYSSSLFAELVNSAKFPVCGIPQYEEELFILKSAKFLYSAKFLKTQTLTEHFKTLLKIRFDSG